MSIQIEQYFFEPTDFQLNVNEIGQAKRDFGGNLHIDYVKSYRTISLSFEGITPEIHGRLLYLVNVNRGVGFIQQNLTLTDGDGNSYTVMIPLEGYSYSRLKGEVELYSWNLRLEEI